MRTLFGRRRRRVSVSASNTGNSATVQTRVAFVERLESRRLLSAALPHVAVAPSTPTRGLVYDSQGFESPTFNVGDLVGQDGGMWSQRLTHTDPGGSSAVIETGVAASGTQALQLNRGTSNIRVWAGGVATTPIPSPNSPAAFDTALH